jgi:hypothetical protein
MPWSLKRPQHRICACCGQDFPASWLNLRKAVRDGKDEFCSPYCRSAYLDGTQTGLPKGLNGHNLIVNRRIQ